MLSLLGAMLGVAATWCLLALMFVGIGRLIHRAIGLPRADIGQTHLTFWIGLATLIVLLQIWHLYSAVDYRCLVIATILGLAGISLDARQFFKQTTTWLANKNRRLFLWGVFIVVGFWANLAIGPVNRPDTINYHIQAVRWASSYPIVPGLGNLHGRLAFNNSTFLYAAMLDVGIWKGMSHHVAHGLPAIVVMLYLGSAIPRAWNRSGHDWPCQLFRALLFPIAVIYTYKEVSSFQPDLITFLIGIVVSSLLFELLYNKRLSPERSRLMVFAICLLSSFGLTAKLSFLPFGFTASVIALAVSWRRSGSSTVISGFHRWRLAASCSLAAALTIVPWMGRGIILSGYPAFPSTLFAFDVPWRVPKGDVEFWKVAVVGYARHHGGGYEDTIGNLNWVGPLIIRELGHVLDVTLPLCCVIASSVWLLQIRKSSIRRNDAPVLPWLSLLPAVLTILFVVATAPCPRFAGAAIWVAAIGSIALTLDRMRRSSDVFRLRIRLTVGLGILLLAIGVVKASRYANGPFDKFVLDRFESVPLLDRTEIVGSQRRAANNGCPVSMYMLKDTWGTWDTPVPATPCYDAGAAVSCEYDLAKGFFVKACNDDEGWDVATRSMPILKTRQ